MRIVILIISEVLSYYSVCKKPHISEWCSQCVFAHVVISYLQISTSNLLYYTIGANILYNSVYSHVIIPPTQHFQILKSQSPSFPYILFHSFNFLPLCFFTHFEIEPLTYTKITAAVTKIPTYTRSSISKTS